jgi:hypothetical protein
MVILNNAVEDLITRQYLTYRLIYSVLNVHISESADNASVVNPTADTTSSSQDQHSQDSALTSHNVRTVTQPPFIRSQSHLAPFTLSQVSRCLDRC